MGKWSFNKRRNRGEMLSEENEREGQEKEEMIMEREEGEEIEGPTNKEIDRITEAVKYNKCPCKAA